ncbi:hypothetical protein EPN52_05570 [bacterium]|nr:MAG: hypothetical protein EPN52_05570 [bacterium]
MIVDLDAFAWNARAWRRFTGGRRIYAVVKADAYGIGIQRAVAALDDDVDGWCVTSIEEAQSVRLHSRKRILCIATLPARQIEQAVRLGVEVSVSARDEIGELTRVAAARGRRVRAQLAVRSVAGWAGADPRGVEVLAQALAASSGIEVVEAWTHLSGEPESRAQLDAFHAALAGAERAGLTLQGYHVASTAPAQWLNEVPGGAVRIGIGLFGSTMGAAPAAAPPLRQVLDVGAVVERVEDVEAGLGVGYGRAYVTKRGDRLLTARFGYSAGMPRSFVASKPTVGSSAGELAVVAMGMQFLTCVGAANAGERLEVLGPRHPLDAVACAAAVLPHELVLSLAHAARVAGTLVDRAAVDGYTTCGDSR